MKGNPWRPKSDTTSQVIDVDEPGTHKAGKQKKHKTNDGSASASGSQHAPIIDLTGDDKTSLKDIQLFGSKAACSCILLKARKRFEVRFDGLHATV